MENLTARARGPVGPDPSTRRDANYDDLAPLERLIERHIDAVLYGLGVGGGVAGS